MVDEILFLENFRIQTFPRVLIAILGTFRLTLNNNLMPIASDSKSEHLLTCLALARRHRLPRALLLERIWPQCDAVLAGQSLNSLTHQLNKPAYKLLDGLDMIVHENGYYYLNRQGNVGVDIDYFDTYEEMGRSLLSRGEIASGISHCEQALALYRGDLCGDSSIQTVIERERLRAAFLELLASLADHYYTQGDLTTALRYIQRLLAHDPCREDVHRQAMRCYLRLDRRSQALRQYQICCQALAIEFEAAPEPATLALFNQIRLDPASL